MKKTYTDNGKRSADKDAEKHPIGKDAVTSKIELAEIQLETIPVETLLQSANPLQITGRASQSALKQLMAQIIKTSTIVPPLVSKSRGKLVILDGHRRVACAKELGIEKLQCSFVNSHHVTVDFLRLNLGRKAFDGRTWLGVWKIADDREMVLRECSDYTAARIRALIKAVGGEQHFEEIVGEINSPNIIDWIEKLTQMFRDAEMKYNRRSVVKWCIRNGVKSHVMLLNGESPANRQKHLTRIMDSITSGKPYTDKRDKRSRMFSRVGPVIESGATPIQ